MSKRLHLSSHSGKSNGCGSACLTDRHSWGLSYTTFELSNVHATRPTKDGPKLKVSVDVKITNTGSRTGSEVIQIYVRLPKVKGIQHPEKQLRSFKKVKDLAPGDSRTVTMILDKYAVSYWHEPSARWRAEKGIYTVLAGTSGGNLKEAIFELEEAFTWDGL